MLIAISGSQGSGKTTILKEIENAGLNVVGRKTSRSILLEWGVSLQEVNNSPDLTIKFQNEIIDRKFDDEKHAIGTDEIFFTERTFADLFTYALVSLGKDNSYSDWLNEYYNRCMQCQQIYHKVYYLKAGHFSIEGDGTRGANIHYSRMADLVMLDFTQQLTYNSKLTIIDTPCLEQRVSMIKTQSLPFGELSGEQ